MLGVGVYNHRNETPRYLGSITVLSFGELGFVGNQKKNIFAQTAGEFDSWWIYQQIESVSKIHHNETNKRRTEVPILNNKTTRNMWLVTGDDAQLTKFMCSEEIKMRPT